MAIANSDLRMFAAIADHGNLSAAARHLKVQKSTVSRALALLEDRLGHRLVERTTRHMRLTEAGTLLLAYAHRVAEEIQAAEAAMEALSAEPSGDLRVSVPHGIAQKVLVPLLPAFSSRYPKIRIGIDLSLHNVDLIEEGIDVAIRFGELPPSTMIARKLGVLPIILVASPAYLANAGTPRSIHDIARHRAIGVGAKTTGVRWSFSTPDGREHIHVNPVVSIGEVGLVRELALLGVGIASVPLALIRGDLAAGHLVHVLPGVVRGAPPVYAVYPSRRTLAPKVKVFVDMMAEALADIF